MHKNPSNNHPKPSKLIPLDEGPKKKRHWRRVPLGNPGCATGAHGHGTSGLWMPWNDKWDVLIHRTKMVLCCWTSTGTPIYLYMCIYIILYIYISISTGVGQLPMTELRVRLSRLQTTWQPVPSFECFDVDWSCHCISTKRAWTQTYDLDCWNRGTLIS